MSRLIFVFFMTCAAFAGLAQFKVSGNITDKKDGSPIIGATVTEIGTVNGAVSDLDGNYSIELSNANARIKIIYVGYNDVELGVEGQSTINISLEENEILLEQVVVVGYGVQKKRDVTASISSLKSKEVEKIVSPNIEQALQGKISGVYVSPSSGSPGSGAVVRIRGTGTLNNANPLYVIDGMFSYDASFVNNQDVESIEVLKDASAAAIYGSRGANGVIIITTKNGRNNKSAMVNLSAYHGRQRLTKEIAMLNGTEFATAYNALRGQAFYPDPTIFGEGSNYQKLIFTEADISNIQLSANGGSELFNYNISGNYFTQEGILHNTNYERATFRLNSETKLNSWLKFGNNISYNITKSQNGPNVVTTAYRMPSLLAPYKEDGSFTDPTFFGLAIANPLADQFYKSNNYTNGDRLFGNLFFEAEVVKNLKLKSNFGFDRSKGKSRYFEPKFEVSPSQRNNADRLSASFGIDQNWIWEQTATYTKDINKDHSITLLAGYTAEERSSEFFGGSREHFPGIVDELLYLSAGNDTTQMNFGGAVDEAIISQLYRVNYGYKGKYHLTLSMRKDQSSRFTEANRTGYFPSMSLGWNVARESFFTDNKIFTDLKIRASYGILGNQASANTYPAAGVVNSGLYAVFGSSESLNQGATLLNLSNPNLHWETSKQTDFGIDGSVLKGKLSFELDWYHRLTYDIISSVPIPDYVGSAESPIVNTAEVLNNGYDISVKYNKIGAVSYNFGLNISPVTNEVKKLSQGKNEIFAAFQQGEPATHTVVGLPIGAFYGYQVAGIFQNNEEIAASPVIGGEKPGDLRYKDVDGNGKIDGEDRTYLGSPIPTLTYGFSTGIEFKGFDFAADLFGVTGNKVYNAKATARFGVYNWEQHVANAWTKENPSTTEPRVTNGGHNYRVSDRFLEDGSFIRLRNLSLGYSCPVKILKKVKLSTLRVYVSATNLWTSQKFSGYSPEFPNGRSPFEVGFDFGAYPVSKSTQLGIDIKF